MLLGGSQRFFAAPPQGSVIERPEDTSVGGDSLTGDAEPRFLEQVQMYVENAAKTTDIEPGLLNYLMACDHVLRFQIPLKRDDGSIETLTCYRAQHKHHLMPTKGGTRYADDITL